MPLAAQDAARNAAARLKGSLGAVDSAAANSPQTALPNVEVTGAAGSAKPKTPPKPPGPVQPVRPLAPVASQAASQAPNAASGLAPEDPFAEEDAFAPIGIRTPGLLWRPSIETGFGFTSNMEGAAGGKSGALATISPSLDVTSDWSRHSFGLALRGSYSAYPTARDLNRPAGSAVATGRVDLSEGMRIDLKGGYSTSREAASSAENPAGTVVPSTVQGLTASAAFTRDIGLFAVTLRTDIANTTYSGGTLSGGGAIASASQRDNTTTDAAFRVGYAMSEAIKPFVEVLGTHRAYRNAAVASIRDANGYGLRGGLDLDFGPILGGDIAVGWSSEKPVSATLRELSGATVDASLVWSPTRLTKVQVTARTGFDPTTLAGSPGSITRSAAVTVSQSVRRDLTAEVGAEVSQRDYVGIERQEQTIGGSALMRWALNPMFGTYVKGSYNHVNESVGEDYETATVMVGFRAQK